MFLTVVGSAQADRTGGLASTGKDVHVLALETASFQAPAKAHNWSRTVPLTFPPDAKQEWKGAGPFYMMDLRVRVRLAAGAQPGIIYVDGSVNGCAPIMLRISIPKGSGVKYPRWITGSFNGLLSGTLHGRSLHAEISEYLPTCSVKPGRGVLKWTVERYGRIRARRITFLAGSGVRSTLLQPAELVLKPVYPVEFPERGKEFPIQFKVSNVGEVAAHSVTAEIAPRASALEAAKPRILHLGTLEGEAEGEFTLTGRKVGKYLADLQVGSSNANHPDAVIAVPVERPRAESQSWWFLLVPVALLPIAFLGWRRLRGRRTRAAGPEH